MKEIALNCTQLSEVFKIGSLDEDIRLKRSCGLFTANGIDNSDFSFARMSRIGITVDTKRNGSTSFGVLTGNAL